MDFTGNPDPARISGDVRGTCLCDVTLIISLCAFTPFVIRTGDSRAQSLQCWPCTGMAGEAVSYHRCIDPPSQGMYFMARCVPFPILFHKVPLGLLSLSGREMQTSPCPQTGRTAQRKCSGPRGEDGHTGSGSTIDFLGPFEQTSW